MERVRPIPSGDAGTKSTARIDQPAADAPRRENKIIPINQTVEGLTSAYEPATNPAGSKNWATLLKRIRGAAHYIREVEDRAQEQEFRVQELLEQVRTDMATARAQAQAAEQHARDTLARANRLIKAAEERAQLAEQRAAIAEDWLQQVADTIDTEFLVEPAEPIAGAEAQRPTATPTAATS